VQVHTLPRGAIEEEESARQLEAKLAWWCRQTEVLAHGSSSCGSAASERAAEESRAPSNEELHGCSEWLRLSLASGSGTASAVRPEDVCNGVHEAGGGNRVHETIEDPSTTIEDPSTALDCDREVDGVEAEPAMPPLVDSEMVPKASLSFHPRVDCAEQALSNGDNTFSAEPETASKTTLVEDISGMQPAQDHEQGQADEPDQEPQSHVEEESARALEHARAWAASLLAPDPQPLTTLTMIEGAKPCDFGSTLGGSTPLWTACGQPLRYRSDRLDGDPSSSPNLPSRCIAASLAEIATPEPRLEVRGFDELFNL